EHGPLNAACGRDVRDIVVLERKHQRITLWGLALFLGRVSDRVLAFQFALLQREYCERLIRTGDVLPRRVRGGSTDGQLTLSDVHGLLSRRHVVAAQEPIPR